MENLKQFTDSLHQKASQVVHWMNQSEPLQTDRSKKPLVESFLLA
jgi:ABC-type transporter Mla subunit MlaD